MQCVRRCSIYGCRSNSYERKDLIFFNFPPRDNPLYEKWLSLCEESAAFISAKRRPRICSKHFHKKDVGYRRLAPGALPALFLTAPPGFAEKEKARLKLAEVKLKYSGRYRMINLVIDTVLEWVRRAQNNPDTADTCKTNRVLQRVAKKASNLLDAPFSVDNHWVENFQRLHLVQLLHEDTNKSRNKSLDLREIIKDIDPKATILSEEEFTSLYEKDGMLRVEQKTASVEVGGKKYEVKVENDADESNSGQSSDNLSDDSVSIEYFEVKSENDDSIDLTLNDDDDVDDGDDMEEKKKDGMIETKQKIPVTENTAMSDFSLVVGMHRKKYGAKVKKNAGERSFIDNSGQSSDNLRDGSVSRECSEVKRENSDSIDLTLNDDDDGVDEIVINANQAQKDRMTKIEQKTARVEVNGKKYELKVEKDAADDESSFMDYSGQSIDNLRDDSLSIECSEVKSENNDSVDCSLNGGNDNGVDDMKETYNDSDHSFNDEIAINSKQEALRHLKLLEDFALKQENYRAIGLLTTLETILKNQKKATDP